MLPDLQITHEQTRSAALNEGEQTRALVELVAPAEGRTLSGYAIRWDSWTDIGGVFMERFAPGSWGDSTPKFIHEHGLDASLGKKPIAGLRSLTDDGTGMAYEAELLADAPYVDALLPGLRAGLYGASFRFRATDQTINRRPGKSAHNPSGLPEVTVKAARVVEISTTTFPAYADSTASLRSTDVTPDDAAHEAPAHKPKEGRTGHMKTIDDLLAELRGHRERMSELDTEYQGRSMAADAKIEYDAEKASIVEKDALVEELRARKADIERFAAEPAAVEHEASPPQIRRSTVTRGADIWDLSTVRATLDGPDRNDLSDRASRAVEGSGLDSAEQTRAAHLIATRPEAAELILKTGSPAYRSAFGKYLAGQQMNGEETRAAMSLTGANGGFAVPYTLDPTIIYSGAGSTNPIRQISRVENISTDVWKGVSSAGITVSRDGEATEVGDDSPTIAQPTVDTSKVQGFVQYSVEIGGDWPNFLAQMGGLLAQAKDDEEASFFTTQLLAGATVTVTAGGTAAFAAADVYALDAALPARYRQRASIVANNAQYSRVRQFDTAGGAQLWKYIRDGRGEGDLIVGRPAYEASSMVAALTTGGKIMVEGDFSNFVIADRLGMTVETVPHIMGASGRPTGERGLYAYWRNGAGVVNASAFRALITG